MTAPTAADTRREAVPHRLTTALLTLAAPLVVALATAAVAVAWADELPDPVAVRWRPQGAVGFAAAATLVGWALGAIALVAVACWVLGTFRGSSALRRRVAAGLAAGFAVFGGSLVLGVLALHRGLADAHLVGDPDRMIGAAAVAGIAAGVLAARATPPDPPRPATAPPPADAPTLALDAGERAVWARTTHSPVATAVGVGGGALVLVLSVALRTPLLLPYAALALCLVTLTQFVVLVDARGLTVRSRLGWPRTVVPLDEVVRADETAASPLAEYGGRGYRFGANGRVGLVLRAGPALLVERTGGRPLVVTADDAGTAAALLNALAARTR